MSKVGRNDPCPCGSGRKYKQCCLLSESSGSVASTAAQSAALDPVAARYNRAVSAHVDGDLDGAIRGYREVLGQTPEHVDARYNLALALGTQGKLEEAVASYRLALARRPDFVEARSNLGHLLHALGRLDEAIDCYRAALAVKPHAMIYNNLGYAQDELGQIEAAISSYRRALELGDTPDIRVNFARCAKHLDGRRADASLCALIARAIDEAWTRPGDLATAAVNLIRTDPTIDACIARASRPSSNCLATDDALLPSELAAFAGNALLITLLENAPVCDFAVERFLTLVRRTMLDAAEDVDAADPSAAIVAFYAAVARQCYLNEYVLACEEGELRRAQALRRAIDEATASNNPIPALALIVAASYAPLGELESSARLRERSWPDAVQAIIVQQIDEPKREQRYRDDMARMTAIDDPVSLQVRQQYEQNPYPRWIRVPIASRVRRLNEYLRQQFPFAEFEPLARDDAIDVLIAGCGTGQEAIEAARQLTGARVVAIDLSAASLAYAKRKTIEAGIDNVRYAQADILELSSASEMFDVITSVGVLHHLADPMTGWRALLNLLRPGGFMRIGLYSEQARRDIVAARAFIAQNGYASTAADIRRARLDLVGDPSGRFSRMPLLRDFYTMSECRDLLFHVQEHRFSVPDIQAMLGALALRFIGFLLDPHVVRRYREHVPHDRALTDLNAWNDFEMRFPDTFTGMYRFWVQKA